jgi:hypothetical protein
MHQFELAGCLTERTYEESIPSECSMTTLAAHQSAMYCWGLLSAIEHGHKMDCSGCDENKTNYALREQRLFARKQAKLLYQSNKGTF